LTLRYGGQYVNDQKDGFGSFSVLPRFDDLFASRNPLEIHWKSTGNGVNIFFGTFPVDFPCLNVLLFGKSVGIGV
jgi:hypothetical protein